MNRRRSIGVHRMLLSFVLVLSLLCSCQTKSKWAGEIRYEDGVEIVLNPRTPLNKQAGRVISMKEELRIMDKDGEFFFESPQHLKTASDGSIIIFDRNQLLKFSEEGRFLKNLFRKGQGPGELPSLGRFTIFEDEIYICDLWSKAVSMDLEGELIQEFTGESFHNFDDISRNWWMDCTRVDLPPPKERTNKLSDCKFYITFIPRNDNGKGKSIVMKAKWFVGPRIFMKWDEFLWSFDRKTEFLFISHSREYQVEVLDLNAGRIIRKFSRDYPRVKYTMTERDKTLYARSNPPKKKYESDIESLHHNGDFIWVKTSLIKEDKGTLFDLFDEKGRYIDSFYIELKGDIMYLAGDVMFVEETDALENIEIVKYRLGL